MWTKEMFALMGNGILETLYVTLASTFFGYLFGTPLGIVLTLTGNGGMRENKVIYKILDILINIFRSIPFLILLILVLPLTRLIVGKSYGTTATIVPLVIAATPFIARMVESSLKEVDHGVIEAAESLGAKTSTIVWKVLLGEARTSLVVGVTIAFATILGYSAMAGVLGGGGLGKIAIDYGYYRYNTPVMVATIVILVLLVQLFQKIGMLIADRLDKRKRHV